jgi:hypothetical protein
MVAVSGDQRQEQESIRQESLIYGGLIGIGVVMVQPFLTVASLDLSAEICVVAFSAAIPLLAALLMVNQLEAIRRRATRSRLVTISKPIAQLCGFVGVIAGFWHILWIAGAVMLAFAIIAVGVHSAGYSRLILDRGSSAHDSGRRDDPRG